MTVRSDTLAIAQFLHPGRESPRVKSVQWCPWNRSGMGDDNRALFSHHRKFMIADACWIDSADQSFIGPVGFWGEWEPQSLVRPAKVNGEGCPTVHHVPALDVQSCDGDVLADTDPFVFGKHFVYNGCQQHTAHARANGPFETFLRRLAPGSMILFGSGVNRRFALDTVFVVRQYVDYVNGVFDDLHAHIQPEYVDISLRPQVQTNAVVDSFRLYIGATREQSADGIFSFTPCVPYTGKRTGFARPSIEIDAVSQSMTQGKKMTLAVDQDHVKRVWLDIVEQVRAAGLGLAHYIAFNPLPVVDPSYTVFRDREDQQQQVRIAP